MVSTTERYTNISPMKHNPYLSTKSPSARKSLRQFSEILYVKHNNSVCGLCAAKTKHKAIKRGNFCGQTLQSAVVIKK